MSDEKYEVRREHETGEILAELTFQELKDYLFSERLEFSNDTELLNLIDANGLLKLGSHVILRKD